MTNDANKALVHRYYDEMWNRWDLSLADELLAPDIHFRGSLGTVAEGVNGFRRYARGLPLLQKLNRLVRAECNWICALIDQRRCVHVWSAHPVLIEKSDHACSD